jgi:hypothetical protein
LRGWWFASPDAFLLLNAHISGRKRKILLSRSIFSIPWSSFSICLPNKLQRSA